MNWGAVLRDNRHNYITSASCPGRIKVSSPSGGSFDMVQVLAFVHPCSLNISLLVLMACEMLRQTDVSVIRLGMLSFGD